MADDVRNSNRKAVSLIECHEIVWRTMYGRKSPIAMPWNTIIKIVSYFIVLAMDKDWKAAKDQR
jgi:hypothetical protein